ncbi:MAG: shikimate kinase [Paludibacteraceae bacterium]
MRIFLIGYMGSGKTTIGQIVATNLNLNFMDMDAHIENKEHKTVAQIFSELGEEKFRELEHKCLLEVAEYENVIISTGGGAPCFFDNMVIMNTKGDTIYIHLTPKELANRLKTTTIHKRPLLAKYQGNDLEAFIASNLEKRESFYNQAKLKVNGTDEEIIDKITNYLLCKV